MKKKILGIIAGSLGAILVSAAIAAGILMLIRNRNVEETGNVLGVEWYDEYETEFTIDTVEELYEFAKLSDFYDFKGQKVILGADLVINEGNAADWAEDAPKKKWTPITDFAGTFDGDGHTISGLYGKGFETPMALFIKTNSKAVIKDMKLLNSYFKVTGSAGVGSFGTGGDGKFEKLYSEAIIDCKGEISGGILGTVKTKATINECWFNGTINQTGRKMGGIVGVFLGGRSTMNNCLFTGKMTTTQGFFSWDTVDGALVGGMTGLLSADAGLVMKDCVVGGKISADHKIFTGTVVGRAVGGSQMNITNVYDATTFEGRNNMIGGSHGTQVGNPIKLEKDLITGINAYKWTMLDYDLFWSAVEGDTPQLKYFCDNALATEGIEKNFDVSWYNSGLYEFTLTDLKDLYGFTMLAKQQDFQGVIIKLGADIVINEGKATDWEKGKNLPTNPWFIIGDEILGFAGTFDGQGHTISGLYVKACQRFMGMFGRVNVGGSLRNFRLVNTFVDATGDPEIRQIGGVVGCSHGDLDSIYTDAIVKSDGFDVGGLAGYISIAVAGGKDPTTVSNCWGNAKVYGKTLRRSGSFIGNITYETVVKDLAERKIEVTNCLNTGYISNERKNSTDDGFGGQYVGGMIGFVWGGCMLDVKDCVQAGPVDLIYKTYAASFIGSNSNSSGKIRFENCFATSDSFEQNGVSKACDGIPNKVREGDVIVVDRERISGIKAYQYTMLDFDKYWGAVKNDVPVLKSFAGNTLSVKNAKKLIDTSWYKEDAKTLVLKDAADFYGFTYLGLAKTFEGQTVQLANDINVNPGWKADGSVPEIICYALKNFAGTFDGKGHTVQGVYIQGGSSDNVALFGNLEEKGVVKNFVLDNSYIESKGDAGLNTGWYTGAIAGLSYGTIDGVYIKDGVTVKSNMPYCGGIVGNWRGPGAIKNCWFDGLVQHSDQCYKGNTGGIVGGISSGSKDTDRTMENCLMTGKVVGDSWSIGGLLGGNIKGGAEDKWVQKVTIKNSVSTGEVISEKFNTWCDTIIGGIEYIYTDIHLENVYETGNITAPGGAKSGTNYPGIGTIQSKAVATVKVSGSTTEVAEEMLIGRRAYTSTELDFWSKTNAKGVWVATNEGTELKQFSTSKTIASDFTGFVRANTDWYTSKKVNGKIPAKTTFELKNVADYLGFVKLFNGGEEDFEGHTVKLLASIDLNPGWDATTEKAPTAESAIMSTPLGSVKVPFKGTFDGGKNAIKGAYIVGGTTDGVALFGTLAEGATIKNLILENSYIESAGVKDENTGWYTGAIVGMAYGTIDSIYVKEDVVVKANMPYCGGIVGNWRGPGAIKNVWFAGTVKHSDQNYKGCTGGIVGGLSNGNKDTDRTMSNALVTGTVIADSWDIGGILGGNLSPGEDTSKTVVRMDNCVFNGEVQSEKFNTYCHTIIGGLENPNTTVYLENVYATDNIIVAGGNSVVKPSTNYPGIGNAKNVVINGTTNGVTPEALQGLKGYSNLNLDFYWKGQNDKGVWVAANNGPELKAFSGAQIYDDFTGVFKPSTAWYDKNPEADVFELYDRNDLAGFAQLANSGTNFAGKTVRLMADITYNEGDAAKWVAQTEEPEYHWTPLFQQAGTELIPWENANVTFDGNNKKIIGLCVDMTDVNRIGLFGYLHDDGVVRDLIIENSAFISRDADGDANGIHTGYDAGAIVGRSAGTVKNIYVEKDVIVYQQSRYAGGIVGCLIREAEISHCWFAGTVDMTNSINGWGGAGGIAGAAESTDALIQNTLVTGIVKEGLYTAAGILGTVQNTNQNDKNPAEKVTVKNSVFNGELVLTNANWAGLVLGSMESTNGSFVAENVYAVGNTNKPVTSGSGNVCIGKISGSNNKWSGNAIEKTAEQLAGTTAYTYTELDFYWKGQNDDGLWVATDEGPELKKYSKSQTIYDDFTGVLKISTAWYYKDPSASTYEIATKADLLGFNELANSGVSFQNKTVKLTDDITLNEGKVSEYKSGTKTPEIEWTPLFQKAGSAAIPYANADITFDGDGYAISGLYVTATDTLNLGFFGYLNDNGIIKNLQIKNSYFYSKNNDTDPKTGANIGAVVGNLWGKVEDVKVASDVRVENANSIGGGIVGVMKGVSWVKRTSFEGVMDMSMTTFGTGGTAGIAGGVETSNGLIEDCIVSGNVIEGLWGTGGVIGTFLSQTNKKITIRNTLFTGNLTITNNTWEGLIFGCFDGGSGNNVTFENVYAIENVNKELKGHSKFAGSVGSKGTITGADSAKIVTADDLRYTNALTSTSLNFYSEDNKNGVWVASYNGPELKKYAENVPSMKWYTDDSNANTFYLANKADLLGFSVLSNNGTSFEGKKIVLKANIALNEGKAADYKAGVIVPKINWQPLFQKSETNLIPKENSALTFDGNGYSISGIYSAGTDTNNIAFFGYLGGGEIKNFKLKNSYFVGKEKDNNNMTGIYIGSVVGTLYGNVENVRVSSNVIVENGTNFGAGIAGAMMGTSQIKKTSFAGTVDMRMSTFGTGGTAGIVGRICTTDGLIEDCLVTGTIYEAAWATGGIAGSFYQETNKKLTIRDTLFAGELVVKNTTWEGLIFAAFDGGSGNNVTFDNVYAIENVNKTLTGYSKFAGSVGSKGTISGHDTAHLVTEDDIKGDAAKTKLQGFDFYSESNADGVWITKADAKPELKELLTATETKTKAATKSKAKGLLALLANIF